MLFITHVSMHLGETDIEFRSGKHYKHFTLRSGGKLRDKDARNVLTGK